MPTPVRPTMRATRRRFLAVAGTGLGAIVFPGAVSRAYAAATESLETTVASYRSRPDLTPPVVETSAVSGAATPGHVLLAPASGPGQHGPLIVDGRGEPVWFHPVSGKLAHDFRVQSYAGRPVLTWWEGQVTHGYGEGEYVIADTNYRELKRFSPANGYRGDLHEFTLSSRGTALVTAYNAVSTDLTPYGGPADGTLVEGVLQELDLRTGAVLLEWHSRDHVGVEESYRPQSGGLWDYFHINSIGVLPDDDLLVSARHTSTVYKLDRRSGEIVWRLGGRKSDFQLDPGAVFAFQHDARGHPGDLVSIFDDGAYSAASAIEPTSRAILLALDTIAMTARLARADANPEGELTTAMGNAELLADGAMFVGWGTQPSASEFAPDGTLRFHARLPGAGTSYRWYRRPWRATPRDRPAIAATANSDGTLDVFMSWNGATEVTGWSILGGASASGLAPLQTVARSGFETSARLATTPAFVAAAAVDERGRTLGRSRALET